MFIPKIARAVAVIAFVFTGYVGCAPSVPSKNEAPQEWCIYAGTEPAKWTFIDGQCGCPPGNLLCAYEASVVRCITTADVTTTYSCANLPPVSKGPSDTGRIWKQLDLAALKLPSGAPKRIHQCIELENRKPANNTCAVRTAQPIFPHFLSRCVTDVNSDLAAPHPPNATPENGRNMVLALDNCGGDDCCQAPSGK